MNGEFRNPEQDELKTSASEGFRDIRPEKAMTMGEANEQWDGEFEKVRIDAEKEGSESPAEDVEGADTREEGQPLEASNKEADNFHNIDLKTTQLHREIKADSHWPDKIIDNIRSFEEYKIYKVIDLRPAVIGDRFALIRSDINWDQKDEYGRSNKERVELGRSPLDKNGNPIELHHIGQHQASPLAELTHEEHRCNGNDSILHNRNMETEVHGQGNTWRKEKRDYWQSRSNYMEDNR